MRAIVGLGVLLAILPACGGLENERADPTPRESDELQAREWHDRVVRLEGEATLAAERGDECGATCSIAARACELAQRICDLSRSDDGDEGTRVLCEDAEPRCANAASAAGARCTCTP